MRGMADATKKQPDPVATALADVPDRACTWCKVPMTKRLVGGGAYIHYTCPKCIFQHTTKREKKN
jgi:hypothetical protein